MPPVAQRWSIKPPRITPTAKFVLNRTVDEVNKNFLYPVWFSGSYSSLDWSTLNPISNCVYVIKRLSPVERIDCVEDNNHETFLIVVLSCCRCRCRCRYRCHYVRWRLFIWGKRNKNQPWGLWVWIELRSSCPCRKVSTWVAADTVFVVDFKLARGLMWFDAMRCGDVMWSTVLMWRHEMGPIPEGGRCCCLAAGWSARRTLSRQSRLRGLRFVPNRLRAASLTSFRSLWMRFSILYPLERRRWRRRTTHLQPLWDDCPSRWCSWTFERKGCMSRIKMSRRTSIGFERGFNRLVFASFHLFGSELVLENRSYTFSRLNEYFSSSSSHLIGCQSEYGWDYSPLSSPMSRRSVYSSLGLAIHSSVMS